MPAGGALYNNLDYSFTVGHENGDYRHSKETPGGGSTELRRQLGILGEFFRSLPLEKLKPAGDAIVPQSQEAAHLYALAEPGKIYVAYLYRAQSQRNQSAPFPATHFLVDKKTGASEVLLHLPAGRYQAEWIEPKTGKVLQKLQIGQTSDAKPLSSPAYSEDVALKIWR